MYAFSRRKENKAATSNPPTQHKLLSYEENIHILIYLEVLGRINFLDFLDFLDFFVDSYGHMPVLYDILSGVRRQKDERYYSGLKGIVYAKLSGLCSLFC